MAVFTEVTPEVCAKLLESYDIGTFVDMRGITAGIENSNFYVTTSSGRWVLTIFERLSEAQLPFYLELCRHLGDKGLAVCAPEKTRDGKLFAHILGKPCSIAKCIPGSDCKDPDVHVCEELGGVLAEMHLAVRDFPLEQENTKGLAFWKDSEPQLKPHIPAELHELLCDEIAHQEALQASDAYRALEKGAVHADLFRNNALVEFKDVVTFREDNGGFTEEVSTVQTLGGVIDFYFACTAPFLYDLAVTVNDWCIDQETGEFVDEKVRAFLKGYNKVRALSEAEHALWKDMLRAAALRFWVSRLYDFYMPREAALLKPLDPTHFEKMLKLRRGAPEADLPWPAV